MVMFMPSQSHSGGVIVKPYTGNIAQELQFLTGEKKKRLGCLFEHQEIRGVFHLQKISEIFRWKFPIGKGAFHSDTNLIRFQAPLCWKFSPEGIQACFKNSSV